MRDPYLYPDSDVLKNLAGIQDSEELKNMEADYTLLRLSERGIPALALLSVVCL